MVINKIEPEKKKKEKNKKARRRSSDGKLQLTSSVLYLCDEKLQRRSVLNEQRLPLPGAAKCSPSAYPF